MDRQTGSGHEDRDDPVELPFQRIRKLEPSEQITPDRSPAVVFGQGGKLRSEGPFLELLLKFASELQVADSLLVVGYSFRDDHVNEIIARWFSESDEKRDERRIVVLDPGDLGDELGVKVRSLQGRRITEREPARNRKRRKPVETVERLVHGRVIHIRKDARDGLLEATRLLWRAIQENPLFEKRACQSSASTRRDPAFSQHRRRLS